MLVLNKSRYFWAAPLGEKYRVRRECTSGILFKRGKMTPVVSFFNETAILPTKNGAI